MKTTKPFNWKIFFILLAACLWGVIAVMPYTLDLQKNVLDQVPVPLWVLLIVQGLQSVILFAIASGLGLLLASRIGLGLPILEEAPGTTLGRLPPPVTEAESEIGVPLSMVWMAFNCQPPMA